MNSEERGVIAPQAPSLAHLKRLWRFLAPYRWRIAVALAALTFTGAMTLGSFMQFVLLAMFGVGGFATVCAFARSYGSSVSSR